MVVCKLLKSEMEVIESISLQAESEISTRLDPDELIETKKIKIGDDYYEKIGFYFDLELINSENDFD